MATPGVSAQLIVFGGKQDGDLAGVLAEVAAAGFAGAEIGTNFVEEDPAEVKAALDNAGLVCSGIHGGFGQIADEAWQPKAIEFCQAIGAGFIMCSGAAPGEGIAAYTNSAAPFNSFGAKCKDGGLTFCYHNHGWEFQEFDGVKGIHKLCEVTCPDLVKLNVDVYWVTVGGECPAAFIDRYGDRVGYYHFKDGPYTPSGSVAPGPYQFTELGKGTVDLAAALAAALRHDATWITYEQDRSELEAKEACRISFECLKGLGL